MAPKKDNLPLTLEQNADSTGTITYANEVIAVISGVAANEVEGIAGMCSGGGIAEVFGRNKNITKGVKVEIGSEEASVDLYVVIEYGTPIQTAAFNVQENVRKAIETMTGLHVVRVDVHVQGVSFEKENSDVLKGLESASFVSEEAKPKAETLGNVHSEMSWEPSTGAWEKSGDGAASETTVEGETEEQDARE